MLFFFTGLLLCVTWTSISCDAFLFVISSLPWITSLSLSHNSCIKQSKAKQIFHSAKINNIIHYAASTHRPYPALDWRAHPGLPLPVRRLETQFLGELFNSHSKFAARGRRSICDQLRIRYANYCTQLNTSRIGQNLINTTSSSSSSNPISALFHNLTDPLVNVRLPRIYNC